MSVDGRLGSLLVFPVFCNYCWCFLSFVFLGGARRLGLSPCNTCTLLIVDSTSACFDVNAANSAGGVTISCSRFF